MTATTVAIQMKGANAIERIAGPSFGPAASRGTCRSAKATPISRSGSCLSARTKPGCENNGQVEDCPTLRCFLLARPQ